MNSCHAFLWRFDCAVNRMQIDNICVQAKLVLKDASKIFFFLALRNLKETLSDTIMLLKINQTNFFINLNMWWHYLITALTALFLDYLSRNFPDNQFVFTDVSVTFVFALQVFINSPRYRSFLLEKTSKQCL